MKLADENTRISIVIVKYFIDQANFLRDDPLIPGYGESPVHGVGNVLFFVIGFW